MEYEKQVDRLVLGYLRDECRHAYKVFLKSHFHNNRKYLDRYIPTRVAGKTLKDILTEYGHICDIVQGRLENTNYYRERSTEECSPAYLIDQLNYLLSSFSQSRASTPLSTVRRSPCESIHEQESEAGGIQNTSDVETTPEHALPGNTSCFSEDSYFCKVQKKTSDSLNNSLPSTEKLLPPEVVTQRLLENKELHKKLAKTINTVLNTPDVSKSEQQKPNYGTAANAELDVTIKTVMKKTEEDPIFEDLIQEIIDGTSAFEATDENNTDCLQDHYQYKHNKSRNQLGENGNNTPFTSSYSNCNEYIQSTPTLKPSSLIMFDGTLDSFVKSNACSVPSNSVQNPIYINASGGLIMVPPTASTVQCAPRGYYFLNNASTATSSSLPIIAPHSQPSGSTVSSGHLSAEEILAMPTVILSDIANNKSNRNNIIKKKTLKTIVPKPIREVPADMESPAVPTSDQNEVREQRTGLKKVIHPKVRLKEDSDIVEIDEDQSITELAVTKGNENILSDQEQKGNVDVTARSIPMILTPPLSTGIKKPTPKSCSHIRSLDFSSPPKINPSNTKTSKSPQFVHKKQAAKTLFKTKTLQETNSHGNENVSTKKKGNGMISQWDIDLRASLGVSSESRSELPLKRKRKKSTKDNKNKIRKVSKKLCNTTDPDGKLLEEALKTPIKAAIELPNSKPNLEKEEISEMPEMPEVTYGKKILSPSKLLATKKNIYKTEPVMSSDCKVKTSEQQKLVTPDMGQENIVHPITAKRNISVLLETPLKNESLQTESRAVLTPGNTNILTPYTFSKTIETNFKNVDLNSIDTPDFPCTPSFPPLTPGQTSTGYLNRPTDYSNASVESYYQPQSDTEQNTSIEKILKEEAERLENTNSDGSVENKVNIISNVVVSSNINPKKEEKHVGLGDHLRIFNKNVIGKKNLSLLRKPSNEISDSSESDDENEESNNTVICVKTEAECVRSSYSLRKRNKPENTEKLSSETLRSKDTARELKLSPQKQTKTSHLKNHKAAVEKPKPTKQISDEKRIDSTRNTVNNYDMLEKLENDEKESDKSISTEKDEHHNIQEISEPESIIENKSTEKTEQCNISDLSKDKMKLNSNKINKTSETINEILSSVHIKSSLKKTNRIGNKRENVLKEMEEKRKRTISLFKSGENLQKASKKINSPKVVNKGCAKRNKRKSDSPKKAVIENYDIRHFMPDLSSDEDDEIEVKTDNNKNQPTTDNAENLISDLKERGIHLMHNKSPNKSKKEASVALKVENKTACLDNKIPSSKSDVQSNVQDKLNKIPNGKNNSSVHTVDENSLSNTKSKIQDKMIEKDTNIDNKKPAPGKKTEESENVIEYFDVRHYKQETEHVVFDEKASTKVKEYDSSILHKKYFCKLTLNDSECTGVAITATPFVNILEIQSDVNVLIPRKKIVSGGKATNEVICVQQDSEVPRNNSISEVNVEDDDDDEASKIDDELMNYAIVGSERVENTEEPLKPVKKRKNRAESFSSNSSEKKVKPKQETKLLKRIDVDSFLNKIHGD